ncbi:entericidin A [Legionella gratiana]|uniref:Entericidin A n=1 Tax=Legionella gratiana TaxID=45066 RepID=A0A378JGP4_9GAMM|nr:entericidin A/B family lipoprotein [Legionella gratiana]STX46108.1 entericidin A [Legionella gratiana]
MNILKKIAMMSIVLATLGLLSACGTVSGFGKDVSHVGKDIQRAAQ